MLTLLHTKRGKCAELFWETVKEFVLSLGHDDDDNDYCMKAILIIVS